MKRLAKKRASVREYTPQNQLTFDCFENPFGDLDRDNRWVVLSDKIPWDAIVRLYRRHHPAKATGRRSVSPRVLIGAIIIKHLSDFDDRETIEQIRENIYLQYFLGYTGFSTEAPFHASVFVDIRKKLTPDLLQSISELLLGVGEEELLPDHARLQAESEGPGKSGKKDGPPGGNPTHKGELLMDATVAPQAVAFPTDLNLLNDGRVMSEKIIDFLWGRYKEQVRESKEGLAFLLRPDTVLAPGFDLAGEKARYGQIIDTFSGLKKPRTYREKARKEYLGTAQNKKPGKQKIRKAIGKQLRFLRRNIGHIGRLLDINDSLALAFPLPWELQRYYWVIQLLHDQQLEMYEGKKHQVDNRLVSIHQPHVRPIVRGKVKSPTEFGAKIHLSMIDGYSFVDTISWDAFHEGTHLPEYVENYKKRYGFYPEKVLADKLYATRQNRKWLNERGIKISAKPLGRPSAKAVENHVSPGERNPIEGLFGRAKTAYGMGRIRARLARTSESWIASIILVLNLVKWAGSMPYCLHRSGFSTSAGRIYAVVLAMLAEIRKEFNPKEKPPLILVNQGWFLNRNAG
jgi:transposase, IS5 family